MKLVPTASFTVRPVKTHLDREFFLEAPQHVYAGDPNWVPPLLHEVAAKFDAHSPFLRHGKLQQFIALDNATRDPIGRIVAGVDHRLSGEDAGIGLIGFFECVNDFPVARALFDAACAWLKKQGMSRARNSIGRSDSGERFFYEGLILIDGFDSPPVVMTPYNPAYYADFFERHGWEKVTDAYTYGLALEDGIPSEIEVLLSKAYSTATESGIRFRTINIRGKYFEQDCKKIYHLAFEKLNFEGPYEEEFLKGMKIVQSPIGQPECCILAEDVTTEKLIGVAFCLPDYNILLKQLNGAFTPWGVLKALAHLRRMERARGVLIGSLPQYRRSGVGMALYYRMVKLLEAAKERGYRQCEISWIYEENHASRMLCETIGAQIYKTYRIYEKAL